MEAPKILKAADILLIEDNPQQAAQMISTIEKHQITDSVLWLEDGIQAMHYLHGKGIFTERSVEHTPKMMFLDIKIPRKNGLEVLYEVRTTPSLKHIPVVFMCSTERELERVESYNHNIDYLILKPLDSLDLTNAMGSISRSNNQKVAPLI